MHHPSLPVNTTPHRIPPPLSPPSPPKQDQDANGRQTKRKRSGFAQTAKIVVSPGGKGKSKGPAQKKLAKSRLSGGAGGRAKPAAKPAAKLASKPAAKPVAKPVAKRKAPCLGLSKPAAQPSVSSSSSSASSASSASTTAAAPPPAPPAAASRAQSEVDLSDEIARFEASRRAQPSQPKPRTPGLDRIKQKVAIASAKKIAAAAAKAAKPVAKPAAKPAAKAKAATAKVAKPTAKPRTFAVGTKSRDARPRRAIRAKRSQRSARKHHANTGIEVLITEGVSSLQSREMRNPVCSVYVMLISLDCSPNETVLYRPHPPFTLPPQQHFTRLPHALLSPLSHRAPLSTGRNRRGPRGTGQDGRGPQLFRRHDA